MTKSNLEESRNMLKLSLGIVVVSLSTQALGAFFTDSLPIQRDHPTCEESMKAFSIPLAAALRVPISQMRATQLYNTSCQISFTYVADEKIDIVKRSWQRGVSNTDFCKAYRSIADRRLLDAYDYPTLATTCVDQVFHFAFVNHERRTFSKEELVFFESVKSSPIDKGKAAKIISQAGGDHIELFTAGAQFGYAYQLSAELKPIRAFSGDETMPYFDSGWVRNDSPIISPEEACRQEGQIASKLMSEITTIGSHYYCHTEVKDDLTYVGFSPYMFVRGTLPKQNDLLPGWWQDRMPLAGPTQDLLECQGYRQSAMENYQRFTGKKPRFAVCVVNSDKELEYWMVGR